MNIDISDLSAKELLDCEYEGVRSYVDEILQVVEKEVRLVLKEYVLTKNDWDQIREIKIPDLFKKPSANDESAVRKVKTALSEVDFVGKGLVRGLAANSDITPPQLYTEEMRDMTVNDLVFRTKVNGFYGCLFKPSTLTEGEEIVNRVALKLCEVDWRIRVVRHRVRTTTGLNADYFAVEFLEGEKVIGVASATYVLGRSNADDTSRMVCEEVGNMIETGLWLLEDRNERGGELIVGGIELKPEYRGNGLGMLLNYFLVVDIVQRCEEPRWCVVMADPLQYQLVPYDYIPKPLRNRFSDDVTSVAMVGHTMRKQLMDILFCRHEAYNLKHEMPVFLHCSQSAATIQPPGRSLESSTDHIGVIH